MNKKHIKERLINSDICCGLKVQDQRCRTVVSNQPPTKKQKQTNTPPPPPKKKQQKTNKQNTHKKNNQQTNKQKTAPKTTTKQTTTTTKNKKFLRMVSDQDYEMQILFWDCIQQLKCSDGQNIGLSDKQKYLECSEQSGMVSVIKAGQIQGYCIGIKL